MHAWFVCIIDEISHQLIFVLQSRSRLVGGVHWSRLVGGVHWSRLVGGVHWSRLVRGCPLEHLESSDTKDFMNGPLYTSHAHGKAEIKI